MSEKTPAELPTTLEKREILYGKGSDPANLSELGKNYLEAGHADEAVVFFQKAGDTAALERIAGEALASGDSFTFFQAMTALGRTPGLEEWRALAEAAEKLGKDLFARRARSEAEEKEHQGKQ